MNFFSRSLLVILALAIGGCGAAPQAPKAGAKTTKKKAAKSKVASKKKKPAPKTPEPEDEVVAADPEPKPAAKEPLMTETPVPVKPSGPRKPAATNEKPPPTDAPPVELVKQKVQFDSDAVTYELQVPADAKVESDRDTITVNASPRFILEIKPGQWDFPNLLIKKMDNPFGEVKLVEETSNAIIIRDMVVEFGRGTRPMPCYHCFVNCSVGHRDFRIQSRSMAKVEPKAPFFFFTLTDSQTMRKGAETLALAEPLPEDPIKLLETLNVKLERDGQNEIVKVEFPETATGSTIKLVENLPGVADISARSLQVVEQNWQCLSKCPKLERLDVLNCDIREVGAKAIGQIHSLKNLRIGSHYVDYREMFTGKDLKELEPLKDLEVLHVQFGPLTDKDLEAITIWPKLRELDLAGKGTGGLNPLHGTGMQQFIAQNLLQALTAKDLAINDDGLKTISQIKSLVRLRMTECRALTDAGVVHLKSLSNLENLDLSFTNVTDASVETLSSMKHLKRLYLLYNMMTDEGRAKLAAALPDCKMEQW